MIRFTKSYGQRLLWLLLHATDRGERLSNLQNHVLRHWYVEPGESRQDPNGREIRDKDQRRVQMVSRQFAGGSNIDPTDSGMDLPAMTEQLLDQLENEEQADPAPLLDRVAEIMQSPFARNRLSQTVFDALRRAILLPSEVRAARELMDQRLHHCPSCNHRFQTDELVTYFNEAMYCSRCRPPQSMACSAIGCDEPSRIPDGLIRRFAKQLCSSHSQAKKDGKPVEAPQERESDAMNVWNAMRDTLRLDVTPRDLGISSWARRARPLGTLTLDDLERPNVTVTLDPPRRLEDEDGPF